LIISIVHLLFRGKPIGLDSFTAAVPETKSKSEI